MTLMGSRQFTKADGEEAPGENLRAMNQKVARDEEEEGKLVSSQRPGSKEILFSRKMRPPI